MSGQIVYLAAEVHEVLQEIAKRRGVSLEQVLSDAVSLEHAVMEAREQGARVLVEKSGHVQELVGA